MREDDDPFSVIIGAEPLDEPLYSDYGAYRPSRGSGSEKRGHDTKSPVLTFLLLLVLIVIATICGLCLWHTHEALLSLSDSKTYLLSAQATLQETIESAELQVTFQGSTDELEQALEDAYELVDIEPDDPDVNAILGFVECERATETNQELLEDVETATETLISAMKRDADETASLSSDENDLTLEDEDDDKGVDNSAMSDNSAGYLTLDTDGNPLDESEALASHLMALVAMTRNADSSDGTAELLERAYETLEDPSDTDAVRDLIDELRARLRALRGEADDKSVEEVSETVGAYEIKVTGSVSTMYETVPSGFASLTSTWLVASSSCASVVTDRTYRVSYQGMTYALSESRTYSWASLPSLQELYDWASGGLVLQADTLGDQWVMLCLYYAV